MRPFTLFAALLLLSAPVWGGEWVWTDIEGKQQAPFAEKAAKAGPDTRALVIVFIDIECPVANYFQPTLRRMEAATREKGARFLFVHPDPEVTPEAARKHAKAFELAGPVVIDRDQSLAKRLKAEVTPEAFVITPDGTVHYRGRVNDMFIRPAKKRVKPRTHDLRDALDELLAGKPVTTAKTKAVGCYIYYPEAP